MKTKLHHAIIVALLFALLGVRLSTAFAQGTAFTYQDQLQSSGSPASGLYDFVFSLSNAPSGGSQVGGSVTNLAVGVTNGLFTTTLDFGAVFTGNATWLAIAVRTNNTGGYAGLLPLQQLTPTPSAIFANTASNVSGTVSAAQLSGTVGNSQLASNSITVTAGTGLTGGGTVALGGAITLNATGSGSGVASVTGNADITASTVGGAVTLGDTATSANTASTIVKRDASGNFTNTSTTLTGNLYLPATTASVGTIYSGGIPFIHAYGSRSIFAGSGAGNFTNTGDANVGVGFQALHTIGNAGHNTAVGFEAMLNSMGTSLNDNTAVGYWALLQNAGVNNTAVGSGALAASSIGGANTAIGVQALNADSTGTQNTANGQQALNINSSGSYNTADGLLALGNNALGSYNTADGNTALRFNSSGNTNIALGYQAGYNRV
jgi:hypothetical protein